jgi:hypothetical protein
VNKWYKYGIISLFAIAICIGAIAESMTKQRIEIKPTSVNVSKSVTDLSTQQGTDLSNEIVEAGRIAKEQEAIDSMKYDWNIAENKCKIDADTFKACLIALETVVIK